MAALLVALTVMAILMTAAMPTWRQMVRREQEAELIFRGQQYAHAIGLFQRRAGPGVLPPNLDVLVEQKFLRKKYLDPITGDDFELLRVSPQAPGQQPPQPGRGNPPAGGVVTNSRGPAGTSTIANRPNSVGVQGGGIMGVASKSKDESLRIYNGRTHYNEWQFMYVAQTQAAGASPNAPGRGPTPPGGNQATPPGRGGPGPQRGFGPPGMTPGGGAPPNAPVNRGRVF
jgi:type II secretory pathway pseudopilin PulG